jgi:hypothetical protein
VRDGAYWQGFDLKRQARSRVISHIDADTLAECSKGDVAHCPVV